VNIIFGTRALAGKGISGAVPAIGNEQGRGTLPVASVVLGRAQDMVLFLAFLAYYLVIDIGYTLG
jgi:hypothetical protein